MEQAPSLDGATPVMTGEGEFGFVWKKQAKFFRAAMKQLRSKVSFCHFLSLYEAILPIFTY